MPDTPHLPHEIAVLAAWSPWLPFTPTTVALAPRTPGVYLFRSGGEVVYAGMGGIRSGAGMRQRLRIYVNGRAPHSGLGNLALERALADPAWVLARVERVRAGEILSVQDWARCAVERAQLEVCWSDVPTEAEALALESAVISSLPGKGLWNRRR